MFDLGAIGKTPLDMMYAESVSAMNTPQIDWKTSSYPEFLVHQQQQQWYLPGQQYRNPPVPVNQNQITAASQWQQHHCLPYPPPWYPQVPINCQQTQMVKEFNPIYPPPHLFHWKPEPPLQNFNPCPPMLQSQTIPTLLPVAANLVPVQNDENLQEPQSQKQPRLSGLSTDASSSSDVRKITPRPVKSSVPMFYRMFYRKQQELRDITKEVELVFPINNPSDFYCQLSESVTTLHALMKKLNAFYADDSRKPVVRPQKNMACVIKYFGGWYRGQLVAKVGNEFEVLCVDYGYRQVMPISLIKEIDGKFVGLPPQAIKCALHILPFCNAWSPEGKLRFLEATMGRQKATFSLLEKQDGYWQKYSVHLSKMVPNGSVVSINSLFANIGGLLCLQTLFHHEHLAGEDSYEPCEQVMSEMSAELYSEAQHQQQFNGNQNSVRGFQSAHIPVNSKGRFQTELKTRSPKRKKCRTDKRFTESSRFSDGNKFGEGLLMGPLSFYTSFLRDVAPWSSSSKPIQCVYPKQPNLEGSATKDVEVVYGDTPSNFYCQLAENSTSFDALMNELRKAYSDDAREVELPREGMACVTKYAVDDEWYRGRIIGLYMEAKEVDVLFVDYGNIQRTPISSVKAMDPEFVELPPQAYKCALFGVESPKTWTSEEKIRFCEATTDKQLSATFPITREIGYATQRLAVVLRQHYPDGSCVTINKLFSSSGGLITGSFLPRYFESENEVSFEITSGQVITEFSDSDSNSSDSGGNWSPKRKRLLDSDPTIPDNMVKPQRRSLRLQQKPVSSTTKTEGVTSWLQTSFHPEHNEEPRSRSQEIRQKFQSRSIILAEFDLIIGRVDEIVRIIYTEANRESLRRFGEAIVKLKELNELKLPSTKHVNKLRRWLTSKMAEVEIIDKISQMEGVLFLAHKNQLDTKLAIIQDEFALVFFVPLDKRTNEILGTCDAVSNSHDPLSISKYEWTLVNQQIDELARHVENNNSNQVKIIVTFEDGDAKLGGHFSIYQGEKLLKGQLKTLPFSDLKLETQLHDS